MSDRMNQLVLGFTVLIASACAPPLETSQAAAPQAQPSGYCGSDLGRENPLVVSWSAAERGFLYARAMDGLVVAQHSPCGLEILRSCKVEGRYDYAGIPVQEESVQILSRDDLNAKSVEAEELEAELAKRGRLTVDLTLVGRYWTSRQEFRREDLVGRCEGATHVVGALTLGAFDMYGAPLSGVGEMETISQDGLVESCATASFEDEGPPQGCDAVLRAEFIPLGD